MGGLSRGSARVQVLARGVLICCLPSSAGHFNSLKRADVHQLSSHNKSAGQADELALKEESACTILAFSVTCMSPAAGVSACCWASCSAKACAHQCSLHEDCCPEEKQGSALESQMAMHLQGWDGVRLGQAWPTDLICSLLGQLLCSTLVSCTLHARSTTETFECKALASCSTHSRSCSGIQVVTWRFPLALASL